MTNVTNIPDLSENTKNGVVLQKQRAYFSTMSAEKCSFKWTIECFSRSTRAVGTAMETPIFPGEEEEGKCKWTLTFYPCGETENKKEYVCLKLCMKKPNMLVLADFELRLKDSADRELCYRHDDWKFNANTTYTWEQLPKIRHLKKVLQDDILVIDLNVTCNVEDVNKHHSPEPPIPYLRMVDHYAELRKSGKLCDATIIIGTTKIPVHRVVLAARSPVFMAMFEHSTKEKESAVIQIEDADCKTMHHLLDFVYSCSVPDFNVSIAMNLLKTADKYDLLDLKQHCANYLAVSLNTANVADILLLADMYSAGELKKHAIDFICFNKNLFPGIDSFDTILRGEARVLVDILKKMSINA